MTRLIDADELKKTFTEECCGCCDNCSHCMTGYKCELIDNAPTVEIDKLILIVAKRSGKREMMLNALRPQGEWIDVKDIPYLANCSNCGYQMDTHEERGYFKFCPSCGADMRGKKNE